METEEVDGEAGGAPKAEVAPDPVEDEKTKEERKKQISEEARKEILINWVPLLLKKAKVWHLVVPAVFS